MATTPNVPDSVKEDEPQVVIVPTSFDELPEKFSLKVSSDNVPYIQIPVDNLPNLVDKKDAISPDGQIVPAYYPTAASEEPHKKNKKTSNKDSSHSENNLNASDRSYPQMVPPSYLNTRKQTTEQFFSPQASPEFLDAYFNYLNQYNGFASQYDQTELK